MAERLQVTVAGVGVDVLERDAEADVLADAASVADVDPGEAAERGRAEAELVGWSRIEPRPTVALGLGRLDARCVFSSTIARLRIGEATRPSA
ncbi:MAG: hypothetical protein HC927_02315 [Deltaproteobacteria bacterium]|nr:hypothetical protein [Deltaproteobacteria bacterium]